jgi:hypothetical protein
MATLRGTFLSQPLDGRIQRQGEGNGGDAESCACAGRSTSGGREGRTRASLLPPSSREMGIAQPPQSGDYEQETKGVQVERPGHTKRFGLNIRPRRGPKVSVKCAVLTMTKLARSQTLAGTNDGSNLSPAGSEQASATPRKSPKR